MHRWWTEGLLVALLCGCAARELPPALTGAAAADDLRSFMDTFVQIHPEPYRFVTAAALSTLVAQQAQHLAAQAAPSELEVGRAYHTVLAAVADSHIEVGLSLYSSEAPLSLLPVLPVEASGQVLVDASTVDLPAGTVLLAIDGQPMADLLPALSALVISEGDNAAARRRELEWDFPRFYHLAHGMQPTYTLQVRLPDGTVQDTVVDGMGRDRVGALRAARRSQPRWGGSAEGPWPTVHRLNERTALLRLPTFGVADMARYREEVDAAFATLDGVERLVLDVRGNLGGLRPNAIAVLNHLLATPYHQWTHYDAAVVRFPRAARPRLSFPFGQGVADLAARFPSRPPYAREGDPLAALMVPRPDAVPRELVVYVDGLTNSAANTFVLALRRFHPAVRVVGEEIGGECGQHIGEFPVVYQTGTYPIAILHSTIRIQHVAVEGCRRGHGLEPDIPVVYTVEDFLSGTDPYTAAAGI